MGSASFLAVALLHDLDFAYLLEGTSPSRATISSSPSSCATSRAVLPDSSFAEASIPSERKAIAWRPTDEAVVGPFGAGCAVAEGTLGCIQRSALGHGAAAGG